MRGSRSTFVRISEQGPHPSRSGSTVVPDFSGRFKRRGERPLRVLVGPRPFQGAPGDCPSPPEGSVTWGRGPVVLAGAAAINADRYSGELAGS